MTPPVGRGGLKLEAALERFGLAAAVRGARAIDVGASTGGFTDVLLRHGAAHVTAIDVGHGQLHPSLAADARVTSLERTHFRTLGLDVAPGPFDFFTVDVSFVAARTMLRGLAFRLRPGAEGVVLVKPQFELPDARVRGGDVSDPNLRRDALERVRARAEALGFTLVAQADSPVAGGSGTVEILAHLRFGGRSAKLPQPGERRASAAPAGRARTPANAGPLELFAVAAPGLEPVVAAEVAALPGARDVAEVPGGVAFRGDRALCYRANLWLRTATRVLVRVGECEAENFATLRRRAAKLPWEAFLAPGDAVEVSASQSRSRLYHTGGIAENVVAAIGDRLRGGGGGIEPVRKVLVRGVANRWTFSVDSSGELLHRRGWRSEGALAPLRETLAAALLHLMRWDPATPFVDPMCGAGTLPIEAAAWALDRAPGLGRDFAFAAWPSFDAAAWERERAAATARAAAGEAAREALITGTPAPVTGIPAPAIVGGDAAAAAVVAARHNAERAGVARWVELRQAAMTELEAPAGRGVVLFNPPYGRRVGDARALGRAYADAGAALRRRFGGWRAGVLVADVRLVEAFGLPVVMRRTLFNGGLRVILAELEIRATRPPIR